MATITCVPMLATASSNTLQQKHITPPTTNSMFSNASFHTPILPINPHKLLIPKQNKRKTPINKSQNPKPFISRCSISSGPKKSGTTMGLLDLEKHFAFYGAYHSNPINVAIHALFVWPILFTGQMILYFTPPLLTTVGFLPPVLVLNWGFFSTLFYALFYIALDNKAGSLAAFLTFFCWVTSSLIASSIGWTLGWKVVLAAQLFCWTGQFIGHGVFEKRAPALLDNLAQAFLMAPFFVLLEVLQFVGYEPYPGFNTRVKARIDADIKQWQAKKHS